VPLLKAEREQIAARLREHTGAARVEIEAKVAKRIVAGVVIRVGHQVIDASVRSHLDALRERLRQVKVREFADSGMLSAGEADQA